MSEVVFILGTNCPKMTETTLMNHSIGIAEDLSIEKRSGFESKKDKPSNPPITPPPPLPPDPRLRDKEEKGKTKPKEGNVKVLIKTEGNL